jgi:hypothetical protein
MDTGKIVLLEKLKELRHLFVLQCENERTKGTESHELNAICCAIVTAERLLASVIASEPEWCQLCGAEKHLVKSGSMWICCECAAVEHANT